MRLKKAGIAPLLSVGHGPTTSMYYEDPDGNSVELFVDNFGDWEKSCDFMENSPEFAALPMGTYVDPEKILLARAAGASDADIHRRGYVGEFAPDEPVDPRLLM